MREELYHKPSLFDAPSTRVSFLVRANLIQPGGEADQQPTQRKPPFLRAVALIGCCSQWRGACHPSSGFRLKTRLSEIETFARLGSVGNSPVHKQSAKRCYAVGPEKLVDSWIDRHMPTRQGLRHRRPSEPALD